MGKTLPFLISHYHKTGNLYIHANLLKHKGLAIKTAQISPGRTDALNEAAFRLHSGIAFYLNR